MEIRDIYFNHLTEHLQMVMKMVLDYQLVGQILFSVTIVQTFFMVTLTD